LPIGGDLIVAIEGQPVDAKDALTKVMNHKRGGDPLRLTVFRNGRNVQIVVKLGEAPDQL